MSWTPTTEVGENGRICSVCKVFKLWSEYRKAKDQKSGYRPSCRECELKSNHEYYLRNRSVVLERMRMFNKTEHRRSYARKYMARKLREKRNADATRPRPEKCEICKTDASFLRRGIVYDHNHQTGKFRGWLCDRCNRVLGLVEDNIEILGSMVTYLKGNYAG